MALLDEYSACSMARFVSHKSLSSEALVEMIKNNRNFIQSKYSINLSHPAKMGKIVQDRQG